MQYSLSNARAVRGLRAPGARFAGGRATRPYKSKKDGRVRRCGRGQGLRQRRDYPSRTMPPSQSPISPLTKLARSEAKNSTI